MGSNRSLYPSKKRSVRTKQNLVYKEKDASASIRQLFMRAFFQRRSLRADRPEETALDLLDSPLTDVTEEAEDTFGPLKDFNSKFSNSTINQRAQPKKARRRRSIAVSVIKTIPESKGNFGFNKKYDFIQHFYDAVFKTGPNFCTKLDL